MNLSSFFHKKNRRKKDYYFYGWCEMDLPAADIVG